MENNNIQDVQVESQEVETETTNQQEEEIKTYTQEEVDEMKKDLLTQEQVNEIIKERIAREKKKAEEDKKEAERLAKLSRDEREKELNKKTQKELEEAKATIRRMNLEHDTEKILIEESLPLEFKGFLIGEDEQVTNENIKAFKQFYDKAINEAVNERLKGDAPRVGKTSRPTRSEIMNIKDATERQRKILENMDLFS